MRRDIKIEHLSWFLQLSICRRYENAKSVILKSVISIIVIFYLTCVNKMSQLNLDIFSFTEIHITYFWYHMFQSFLLAYVK